MTEVRPASIADIHAVATLETAVFGGDAWSADSVASEFAQRGRTRTIMVADDDAVVGYAVIMCTGEIADLLRIAVHAGHRRSGLATAMLSEVLIDAAARGCQRCLLEVAEDNTAALAFYGEQGFTPVSRRRRYYSGYVDAVVMSRPLPT